MNPRSSGLVTIHKYGLQSTYNVPHHQQPVSQLKICSPKLLAKKILFNHDFTQGT
jgi:hypothetical protein